MGSVMLGIRFEGYPQADQVSRRCTAYERSAEVIRRLLRDEDGQDVIEWALLVAFLSVIVIGTVTAIGPTVQGWHDSLVNDINSAP